MTQGTPVKIVVFYAEVAGYVIGTLKALTKCDRGAEIDVVHWDRKGVNSTQFVIEKTGSVRFHARSALTEKDLFELLRSRDPDIIVVSGWMDKGYLRAVGRYRAAGGRGKVVCASDTQWEGTLAQHLRRGYFRLFHAQLFDFMWVPGKPQYHLAQRLGYDHERIISNLLSADGEVFHLKSRFSKRFVFTGRFDPVKALTQLIDAYLRLPQDVQSAWPLVLIGDGELRQDIQNKRKENIVIKPYLQPAALMNELMEGGVACITSHHEQWGVAIHEMAILGFPFVLSSACGAASEFLISGYNGFLFRRSDADSLWEALLRITMLSDKELELFSERSHALGQRITSEYAAYSLLSAIPLSKM